MIAKFQNMDRIDFTKADNNPLIPTDEPTYDNKYDDPEFNELIPPPKSSFLYDFRSQDEVPIPGTGWRLRKEAEGPFLLMNENDENDKPAKLSRSLLIGLEKYFKQTRL